MIAPFVQELERVFGWLVAASWQASVLAVFVLLIQRILGSKLNPRWRYTLWLLVLLRLVLPVQPESALSLFQFAPKPPAALEISVTEPLFNAAPSFPMPDVRPEVAEPSRPFSFYSLLAIIWLAGAMALLLLTWMVNRRFARQVADSPEIADPELLRLFAETKAELGVRRAIRLIENGRVQSPAIMGLFAPTLLLPAEVREKFDARELRFIFLHELAHLKRGDVMVQALIALLQILHWFNPVLWYAFRRMRIDREPATDALVLSRTGEDEKERYGLMLIKLLEHFNQRHSLPTLVGILEDKDQFKRRFSLIARFTRGAYGWSVLGLIVMSALAVVGLTSNAEVKAPTPWPPPDLSKSAGFFPLMDSGEIVPPSDTSLNEAINNLTLSNIDFADVPMQGFLPELAALLKKSNPDSPQISFYLTVPKEDEPYRVLFHLSQRSNLRAILDQLNEQYPIRYQIRGIDDIVVWQVSHFESAFDKKAREIQIRVDLDHATLANALKAVQSAAAAKGFVFDIANFDDTDRFPPNSPLTVTLRKDQITVDQALRFILEIGQLRLTFERGKYLVAPALPDFPMKEASDLNSHEIKNPGNPHIPLPAYVEVISITPVQPSPNQAYGTISKEEADALLKDPKNKVVELVVSPAPTGRNTITCKTASGPEATLKVNWKAPQAETRVVAVDYVTPIGDNGATGWPLEREEFALLRAANANASSLLIGFTAQPYKQTGKDDAGTNATEADLGNRPEQMAQFTTKLKSIHVELPSFAGAPLGDVISILCRESKKGDPSGQGIDVLVPDSPPFTSTKVTLSPLSGVSLYDGLRAVCEATNLEFYVDENIVRIHEAETLLVKTFVVPDGFFPAESGTMVDVKQELASRGIALPSSASATYVPGKSRLVVRATALQLLNIEDLLAAKVPIDRGGAPTTTDASQAASTGGGEQGKTPGDHIKIRLIMAEIKKEVYLANKEKVEVAVKNADIGYLNQLTGVNVLSAPSVETDPGEKATVEITRELPFPVSFEKDKDGKFTPTDFDTRDCGIKADLTPKEQNGKIQVSGNLTLTDFEGFTFNGDSDTRVGCPTFTTVEGYIFEEFENENQFKGMLLPGIQHEPPTGLWLAGKPNLPAVPGGSDTRLIVFLSAGRVK
jgi:bla regulator protein BlaR1